MNGLALSAVILFTLLIPGIILPYRYYKKASSWETSSTIVFGVERLLTWALIVSIPLHCMWGIVIKFLDPIFHWGTIDYGIILELLQGIPVSHERDLYNDLNNGLLFKICCYMGSQIYFAWNLGDGIAKVVTHWDWNKKTALSSKGAFWHQALAYPSEEPDAIVLSLALTMGGENYLYHGLLYEYQLSDDGDLHRVVLQAASRSRISANDESEEVEIDGEYLAINCDQIQTANIDYLWINESEISAQGENLGQT